MNPSVEDLIYLKSKLESYSKLEDQELISYIKRLEKFEISKELIKKSQINEILKTLSKNKNKTISEIVVNSVKQLREIWKSKLSNLKKNILKAKKEIISKNLNDVRLEKEQKSKFYLFIIKFLDRIRRNS
jgi:Glu-tRNA(Gln) amidotransferase subunit E-like FAD-binding protein